MDGYGYFLGQWRKGKKILAGCNCAVQLIHTKFFWGIFWYFFLGFLVLLEGSLSQTNHKRKRVFKTNLSHLPTLLTLNSKDFISKSSYCLPYNSCDVRLESLGLDQPIIPYWYFLYSHYFSAWYFTDNVRRNSV